MKLRNLMALSKKSNTPPLEDEFSSSSSRYVANIHGPQFMRLPRSIRVKETVPTGTVVFKVRVFFNKEDSGDAIISSTLLFIIKVREFWIGSMKDIALT